MSKRNMTARPKRMARRTRQDLIVFTSDNGACAEWNALGFDIQSGPQHILHRSEQLMERTLYFEHEGNRAVRVGRWKLVALRSQQWELYDMLSDRAEMHDVSAKHPTIAQRLSESWDAWAKEYYVTPLPKEYGVEYIKVSGHPLP